MVPKVEDIKEVQEEEGGGGGEEGEEVSSKNEKWKILYQFKAAFNPIMPSRDGSADGICPLGRKDSCPPGHQLVSCPNRKDAYYCKQCSDLTFQPDENWLGDKCRLRVSCRKDKMFYINRGSTTRDAVCGCQDGYYLPNNMDQRACFSNPICDVGEAPGKYGVCESCLEKGMYSDTKGPMSKKCKPLTNCAKQGKCLEVISDGTFDNVCGPKMGDTPCKKIEPSSSSNYTKYFIAAGAAGAVLLLIAIIIAVIAVYIYMKRRKRHRGQYGGAMVIKAVSIDEMEQIRLKVLKESERDPALCKKAISTSFSFIEERIGRQIWPLAQELFRSHPIEGKYELIVDKYKACQAKYTVNGYLQEWRTWRGDTREAVADLFQCLKQVNREDLVNETCAYLRNDIEIHLDSEQHNTTKTSSKDECLFFFSPCCYPRQEKANELSPPPASSHVVVENSPGEASVKLLEKTEDLDDGDGDGDSNEGGDELDDLKKPAGVFYRSHPTPSAPALEDVNDIGGAELDSVKFSRQYSQPVQATS